ncbi:amino acid/polyamine transporter I [Zopfochytrium polystomum]|nr:amino acid/polyamine transporter I [Zopfochytrium polystomum]
MTKDNVEAQLGKDDADASRLEKLGYKQELNRSISSFSNFGATLSIVSIPAATYPLFFYGLSTGGPAAMLISWPIVGVLSCTIGISLGEIISAYPTAGGVYYWSANLSGPKLAPVVSFFTGWFNFIGQMGLTAAASFAAAQLVIACFYAGGVLNVDDHPTTSLYYKGIVNVLNILILLLSALLNTTAVKWLGWMASVSVFFNIGGMALSVILAAIMTPTRIALSDLFNYWVNATGLPDVYCGAISVLVACFTFCGYDSAAHLIEETKNADIGGPVSIVSTLVTNVPLGWFLLMGLLTTVPANQDDLVALALAPNSTSVIVDVLINATTPAVGIFLTIVVAISIVFCAISMIATHSRMIFAFSRDGAVPDFFHRLSDAKTPTRAVWLAVVLDIVVCLPSLGAATAFTALTALGTVGLYVSYAIPIFFRVLHNKQFIRGRWNVGAFGPYVAAVAVVWVAYVTVALNLPTVTTDPWDPTLFNWAPVELGGIIFLFTAFWVLSARKWFKGPKIDEETLKAYQ